MIPPSFCDLGKATKDLFNKNFHFGLLSVEYLSKSAQGVELTIKGDNSVKAGKLNGSLEWKYKFENGLKNSVKWDTKNEIGVNFSIEDFIKTGSKLSADLGFNPDSGNKKMKMQTSFKRKYLNCGMDMCFTNLKPILIPSLVIGCTENKGYLLGAEINYDTNRMSITRHTFSLGYHKDDLSLIGSVINKTDVETHIYQRINPNVEVGVQIKWNWNSRNTEFGVAGKYQFDNSSIFKGKIDNKSILGLGYVFRARDNVDITLNAEIDGKDLEKGAHRFGMGLSYAPR